MLGSWLWHYSLWLNSLWLNRLWLNRLWLNRLWLDRLGVDRFVKRQWGTWFGGWLGADIVILSRCELSEKLTVPFGHSSGSIDTDQVGVIRVDLQDYTSLGPAVGMGTSLGLVLDVDVVARLEGREELGALGQLLLLEHPPLGVCQLTLVSS